MCEPVHHNRRVPRARNDHGCTFDPVTYAWPWRYERRWYSQPDAKVIDGDGRIIASYVIHECGPLLAAGPCFLAALLRISRIAAAGSMVREIADRAIEEHIEREGMQIDGAPPWELPKSRHLRIVGVAT